MQLHMEVKAGMPDLVPGKSGVHLTIFRRNSKSMKSLFSCHSIVEFYSTTADVRCAKLRSDSWTPRCDFKNAIFNLVLLICFFISHLR